MNISNKNLRAKHPDLSGCAICGAPERGHSGLEQGRPRHSFIAHPKGPLSAAERACERYADVHGQHQVTYELAEQLTSCSASKSLPSCSIVELKPAMTSCSGKEH